MDYMRGYIRVFMVFMVIRGGIRIIRGGVRIIRGGVRKVKGEIIILFIDRKGYRGVVMFLCV